MDYIAVGKLVKPHGIHGALQFIFDVVLKESTILPSHFFIYNNGLYNPLFIERIEMNQEQYGIVYLEESKDRNSAFKLSNTEIYLSEKDFELYFVEIESELDYLIGYTAYNNDKSIGDLIAIEEMPFQYLAVVKQGEKEHLIPLVDEFVLDISEQERKIIFDLPEGLLEL